MCVIIEFPQPAGTAKSTSHTQGQIPSLDPSVKPDTIYIMRLNNAKLALAALALCFSLASTPSSLFATAQLAQPVNVESSLARSNAGVWVTAQTCW